MSTPLPRLDGLAAFWDAPVSQAHGLPLFSGFLEPTWGCIDVVEKLSAAIESNKLVLPQKYLYASLNGARLWKELCDGHSPIAEVYRQFPLNRSDVPLTKAFLEQAKKLIDGRADKKLGVVALGAGTGQRESQICGWLADKLELERLFAVVLDVSSELLGVSLQRFNHLPNNIRPLFAVLDFESSAGLGHLQSLRNTWGEHPALFLLLGNTLGNLDEVTFLKRMAEVMRPDDLLLCEMLLTTVTEKEGNYEPTKDDRAKFIIDPLRALGINPKVTNLKCDVTGESGTRLRSEFRYHFDTDEVALPLTVEPRPQFSEDSWIGLLEIQALTPAYCKRAFEKVFERVELIQHPYPVSERKILMGYCFAAAPRTKIRVVSKKGGVGGAPDSNDTVALDPEKHSIGYRGDECVLFPTHYALLEVLKAGTLSTKALEAQDKVIALIEAYLVGVKKPDGKVLGTLKSLKTAQSKKDTDAMSKLKRGVKTGLATKAKSHISASELLKIWPDDEQWCFRASSPAK